MHGVNLGGWLVLEKWITPSLFAGHDAEDEYSLCLSLGKQKIEFLARHRASFITANDFKWLAQQGIEAVRLPLGWWVFGAGPYVPAVEYVDLAFEWSRQAGLAVILDLHGAPGSQNGNDHSGRSGPTRWQVQAGHITKSLEVIRRLAERYKNHPNLYGIELLNEPGWSVPAAALKNYYRQGYWQVRQVVGERVKVIFSDGYRHYSWAGLYRTPAYSNTAQDVHLYQVFSEQDRHLSFNSHLNKATGWQKMIRQLQTYNDVLVGEWSLALPSEVYDQRQINHQMQAYARAQLAAFAQARAGWFFWTYKTESAPAWSLRDSIISGWLTMPRF